MAKFCTKCGRPLKEGEICICQREAQADARESEKNSGVRPESSSQNQANNNQEGAYYGQTGQENRKQSQQGPYQENPYQRDYRQTSEGLFSALNGISSQLGAILDAVYDFVTPTDRADKVNNRIPIRKLLGFSKEDRIKHVEDCYERGAQIVPDLIQPCSQEIPIRQYELCKARSALSGSWQEGRLQVTSKRVLYRMSGRNWIGPTQKSMEFALEDVVGMEFKNGNKLCLVAMVLNLVLVSLFFGIGSFITSALPMLGAVLGLIGVIGILVLLKRHYYAKVFVFAFAVPGIAYLAQDSGKIGVLLSALVSLGFFIYFILASIRPSFSIKVLTKSDSTVISMLLNSVAGKKIDVLPGKDAERVMDEVGTMVMDIQKYGEAGIQKWKL
ncbi:MAG TPA: 7TM-DISM domain-containing protein [Candidatus Blautia gallistercoris]|uniref:7TM-DISM domain-containing protein n=1 Tax=Candidatus Blautia gallistercoris TaxID=2838490 RepID=A0A9D1WJH6_9FIRM|nr:7TM-DISM domain-containing protein [Candidatus Blautia gallistercoris]